MNTFLVEDLESLERLVLYVNAGGEREDALRLYDLRARQLSRGWLEAGRAVIDLDRGPP